MKYQALIQIKFSIVLFLATILWSSSIIYAAPGDVDLSFNPPNFSISGSFSSLSVYASVLQPNGKIVVGGSFSSVDGTNQISLARLNADGSRDATFVSPFVLGSTATTVYALALQTDGKILVGGILVTPGGTKSLIRVNVDGSLDTSFVVAASSVFGQVLQIVVEPDGKILASGNFSGVSRLNPDGSFVGAVGTILQNAAFVRQPDGKIIISGMASFGGDATFRFVGADIDPTFHGGTSSILAVKGLLELQSDGKVIIYGASEYTVDGITRRGMIRLTASGAVDTSLNAGNFGGGLVSIKLQPDGKIVAGGFFFPPNESSGYGFARFNANGTLDSTFPVAPPTRNTNDFVRSVLIQPDGKIIFGGNFTQVAGIPRSLVVRVQGSNTNPSPPDISIGNVSLNEGNSGTTAFSFTVGLSAAAAQTVTVNYATANGTAVSPIDYQATSGALSFAPGEIAKTVTVLVNGDTTVEPNETFTVSLSGATNANIFGGTGTGTIINDDVCAYSISPTSLNIGAAGGAGNSIAVTTQAGCAYTAVSNNPFITINSGASGSGSGTVTFTVAANSGAARTGTITVAGRTFTVNQAASATFRKTLFDFDGDGKADISVYRPNAGIWYLLNSTAGFTYTQWGINTDKPVPADYDGDGKTDIAIYRPNTGTWYILNSTTGSYSATQFGISTDIPVAADYDGDGKANIAIYRPNTGTWYILYANGGYSGTQFGINTDKLVPADYNGDGKTDIAIYRPNTGIWYVLYADGSYSGTQFGINTDIPIPADYDGDGKANIAIYRPNTGTWYILYANGGYSGTQFGINTDKLVPADYNGDGKTDIAIYRPNTGIWYVLYADGSYNGTQFGISTDIPIPTALLP